jgi:hypothetical protein
MVTPFRSLVPALVLGVALAAAACTPAPGGDPGGGTGGADDGSGGSGGQTSGSGGRGGSQPTGSGGAGGVSSTGGATGSGGTTTTGGSGGGAGGASGSGGSAAPKDGGASDGTAAPGDASAPTGDASGPPPMGGPAKPSAGCGKVNPATGARTVMTGGRTGNFMVALPPSYDPNKPYPLGFAFHGFNLNEKTCYQGSECPGFRTLVGMTAITVFPKSIGPGWEAPVANLAPNIKFVEDIIALMKAEYCVDENRVFVSGVSSGGQMVHHVSCQLGDRLWAGAPIAGYVETAARTNCKGTPAEVVIHGVKDNLKNGQFARDMYAMRNGCPTPPANLAAMEAQINAAFTAKRKEYACVDYVGCTKNPVRYCLHSEPLYAGNTHGWPDTGGKMIADFIATLK